MNNGMVGFNPGLVNRSLDVLQAYSDNICRLYYVGLQDRIVVPLSEAWFAPESKGVMGPLEAEVKRTMSDFNRAVGGLSNAINTGAQRWAESVGDSWSPRYVQPSVNPTLDVSIMKDENNGFRGVYSERLPEIYTALQSISQETSEYSESFKQNFSGVESFVGSEQMTNLINTITAAAKTLEVSTDASMGSIKKAIEETNEKYQTTAQANAQTFASGN